MSQKKKRNTRYVSEAGTAIYPYLLTPDTEYNPDGEYKVKLKLSPDAGLRNAKGEQYDNFQGFLDAMLEKAVAKAKQENPKKRIKTADAPYQIDEDDGSLLVNFKLKALVKNKKDNTEFNQQPAIFDAKGKPFEGDAIYGGSVLKASFEVIPFYTALIGAGITLRLKAVQVIELRTASEPIADSYGFGEEEGYESEPSEAEGAGFTEEVDEDDIPFDTAEDAEGDF